MGGKADVTHAISNKLYANLKIVFVLSVDQEVVLKETSEAVCACQGECVLCGSLPFDVAVTACTLLAIRVSLDGFSENRSDLCLRLVYLACQGDRGFSEAF